jgi:prepilin-type N-terminal cleavage/methylation domain-containing protein
VRLIINSMNFSHINKKRRTSSPRGFTLVETLVSTMIITLVVLGPLTVASNASTYARLTKDTLIATYLAQEAIELLRYQQDSVYIRCIQGTSSECTVTGNEATKDAAWRLFRARLGSNSQGASCFDVNNASGCSYDFIDMTANPDFAPTKYISSQSSCSTLSLETATNLYVCSGVHGTGSGYGLTRFSRSVSITSVPTFGDGTSEEEYNDDLRVTVTITFKRPNGYLQQVKVVDFLHARA